MKAIKMVILSASMALCAGTAFAQTTATPESSKNGGLVAPASPGNAGESLQRAPQRMKSDEERRAQRDANAATRAAIGNTPPAQGTSMGAGPSSNSGNTTGSSGTGPAAAIPRGTATQ